MGKQNKPNDVRVVKAEDLSAVRYTKRALIKSSWYTQHREFLQSKLDENKTYTKAETDNLIARVSMVDDVPLPSAPVVRENKEEV